MTADGVESLGSASIDFPLPDLTKRIIGAAFEVHKALGPGFLEKVYEAALLHELRTSGLRASAQAPIVVKYKNVRVGDYYADILVDDAVIVEVKACDGLVDAHEAQVLNYLKATGKPVGLFLNFGTSRVQVKRLARTRR